jgi:hypothetical protein
VACYLVVLLRCYVASGQILHVQSCSDVFGFWFCKVVLLLIQGACSLFLGSLFPILVYACLSELLVLQLCFQGVCSLSYPRELVPFMPVPLTCWSPAMFYF